MKILHVIDSLDLFRGGPVVCAASIAASQAAQGNDVSILSYDLIEPEKFYDFLKFNVPGSDKINFVFISNDSAFERRYPVKSISKFKLKIIDSDVVHVHGMWHPLLYKSCVIAKKNNIKYVLTPHGMLDPWSLSQKRFKKKLALALGWKSILNNCHYLHALNDDEAILMGPLGLKSKIEVISNGVFEETFSNLPDKEIFLNKFPRLRGKRFILFLSRLHYKKGLDFLIDSYRLFLSRVHDVDLVIAGPDDGWKDELLGLINDNDLSEKVHIIGPVYNEIKYSAYLSASCFCLPSRQEGFSIAITEAMACKLPVIISKPCNFNEVDTVKAGFVVDLDVNEIAEAMIKVVSDKNMADKMGFNGSNLIFTKYTWEHVARRLVAAY